MTVDEAGEHVGEIGVWVNAPCTLQASGSLSSDTPPAPGVEIVDWFYDAAVSGADPVETRPGFAAMLERIEGNGVRLVLVEDVAGFAGWSRPGELGVLVVAKRGVRVVTAGGEDLTDARDPAKVMMRQVAGAFAEYARRPGCREAAWSARSCLEAPGADEWRGARAMPRGLPNSPQRGGTYTYPRNGRGPGRKVLFLRSFCTLSEPIRGARQQLGPPRASGAARQPTPASAPGVRCIAKPDAASWIREPQAGSRPFLGLSAV